MATVVFSIPEWGSANYFETSDAGLLGVLGGGALIFFSYVGFEDLVATAEEAKSPRRDLPKALIISSIIVMVVYLLIAISAISVMDAKELSETSGPLAEVMRRTGGEVWATILIVVALFATSKTILSNTISTSRLIFDVARDNDIQFIKRLAKVEKKSGTPRSAIFLVGIVVLIFALIGNLKIVASLSNIFVFSVFIMVNIALIRYRLVYANKNEKPLHKFEVPLNVKHIPIPTVIALIGLAILFVFNLQNIFS